MILLISFQPGQVLYRDKGQIVLKLNFFNAFAIGAYLATFRGKTYEDFVAAQKAHSRKYLDVGKQGGISVENCK